MKWQMPIGVDNFFDIQSKHYYFVDKTDFIRQLIDGHSAVTLITRPRRFGKTLTLSMLEYFFSIEKMYFSCIFHRNVVTSQRKNGQCHKIMATPY